MKHLFQLTDLPLATDIASGRLFALPRRPRGSTRRSSVLWSWRKGDMGQTLCLISSLCHPTVPSSSAYAALHCSRLLNHTSSSAQVLADELTAGGSPTDKPPIKSDGIIFIKIRVVELVNFGRPTRIRSSLSWIFSVELCSVVCSLFSLLFVCLTVPQWATLPPSPLAAPENKQPSLSFQGGVLTQMFML